MTELLWAPWRIEYIEEKKEDICIFCRGFKERDDKKNLILYRSELCFVIMNRFPYNSGHLMVAPNEHIGSIEELPDEVLLDMMNTVKKSVRALKDAINPDGFNIGINQGKSAGAGIVDHVHIHIVPRWTGDTNFMPVLSNTRVVPEYLERTYDKLKPHF